MPLRRIKQTSKLLLLEEFCASDLSPDLYTFLRNEDVEQKSEFFSLIEKNLEVKSYEEFTKKFMPSVWEWMEQSNDPTCPIRFCYSLEKPDRVNAHEMQLNKNEFYAMVMDLYSKKGISGESNLAFDYSKVAELLSPRKVMENAKQLRKDLQYNYNKILELGESSKVEKNKYIKKIKEIRGTIVSQYKDSFIGKIKLALADTENKLASLPDKQSATGNTNNNPCLPCKASFDENGDVEIILIEDNQVAENNVVNTSGDNKLALWIGGDFDKNSDEKNDYIRNLVISNYSGDSTAIVQLDRNELIKKRNEYTTIYKASQEQFIRAISSAVEKILDVKVFFEQASDQNGKLLAPIIVANCKANKLVEDEEVKRKFEYFIKETEKEIDTYKIWFAIIPAIGDEDFIDNPDVDYGSLDDLDDLDFSEDKTDNTVKTTDGDILVSTDALKVMLKILQQGKITTFFNYRANEKTGFGRFNNALLDKYREKLDSINGNAYAVFCYPNFSILPKKETAIEVGKTGDDGNENKEFIDIPGIYVDSSYVAAGLVVASQNPAYLEKKGFKVNKNNPCVRFDLEDNRFVMLTNMNREGKGNWTSEVEDNIGSDKFGFCFCGNTKYYKDKCVQNTYVYVTRNMHKDKSGVYDPIYTRLTMDFVMQYLQTENITIGGRNKFKSSMISKFISEDVGAWKREAESEIKANSILHDNEDIKLEDDTLIVQFENTEAEIALDIDKNQQGGN